MARNRQSIDAWIAEVALGSRMVKTYENNQESYTAQPCTILVLFHMIGTGKDEVFNVPLQGSGKKYTEKELGQLFLHKAETRAQDLAGVQTFRLEAYFTQDVSESYVFTVSGITEFDGLVTENPDAKGLAQQSMRHTEAMTALALRGTTAALEQMTRMNETMGQNAHRLTTENIALIETLKMLLIERDDRDHKREIERLAYERATKERELLMKLAPALANTITGKEVFPQAAADTALVEGLARAMAKVPKEHLMGLAEMLPNELLAPLMTRVQQVVQQAEEEEKRTRMMVPANDDPIKDAMGD